MNLKYNKEYKSHELMEDSALGVTSVRNIPGENHSNTDLLVAKRIKRKKRRKIFLAGALIIFSILIVLSLLAINFIVIPAKNIYGSFQNIQTTFQSLLKDFDGKDLSNIDFYFANIQLEIGSIESEINRFDFLKTLDQTKGYYENFIVIKTILGKADKLVEETLPNLKKVLGATGFTVEATTAEPQESVKSGEEGTITLILKELPLYLELYNEIEPKIIDLLNESNNINIDYVPSIGGLEFKDDILELREFAKDFPEISSKTKTFLSYIPKLIGSNSSTTYLILLQSISELRSSGGLITASGHLTLQNGEFNSDIVLEDTWNLEIFLRYILGINTGPDNFTYGDDSKLFVNPYYGFYQNFYGQNYLMYGASSVRSWQCGSLEMRFQDAGVYPDIYESVNILKDYYENGTLYDPGIYPDYNYVLVANDTFFKNLLKLIEPLEYPGLGLITPENFYNIIKSETDVVQGTDRKEIIKNLSNLAKEKFFALPLADLPKVIDLIVKSFYAKDLALVSPKDAAMQQFFDEYGMSGRIPKEFTGDYFQLSEAQNCALKLNNWVRDNVVHTVYIDSDGLIRRKVSTYWIQPKVYGPDIPNHQYDPTTQKIYRAWVRYFTPVGSSGFISDGYYKSDYLFYTPVEYFDSTINKQVSDNIIAFDHRRFSDSDPIPGMDLNVDYNLPSSINYVNQGEYKILLQKHPGKSWGIDDLHSPGGERHTININYNGEVFTTDVVLDQDKVVSFKDGIMRVENYNTSFSWIMELVNKVSWEKIKN